ncbi:MAG: hypothetical protein HY840_15105, partial [Bacteroidetes bacterium]|nr:hypothetical protein [Bacteroidota bacterium]
MKLGFKILFNKFLFFILFLLHTTINAQTLLYTEDFTATFPPTGWLIFNAGTGNNWSLYSATTNAYNGAYCMQYIYNSSNAANTWAFTQGFSLTAGKSYYIEFYQKVQSATYSESMKVTVGTAQTTVSQTTTLLTLTSVTNTTYTNRVTGWFNPCSSSTYYFAFNCFSAANMYNLYVDNIRVYEISSIPYSQNFDGLSISGWTLQDVNADGKYWGWYSGADAYSASNYIMYPYHASNAANDWIFSPSFYLTGGYTYQVSFWYRAQSASYPEKMEVKWGSSNNAASMTNGPIFDNSSITNTSYTQGTGTFTPGSTGCYYIGWHCYSAANMYNLLLDNVSITLICGPAILSNNTPVTTSTYPTNYQYANSSSMTAVVAVAPNDANDHDCYVYSAGCQGGSTLSSSTYGANVVDYNVAHYNVSSTVYPSAQYGSTGTSTVEFQYGTSLTVNTPYSETFTYTHAVEMFEVYLTSGTTYDFTLTISGGGCNLGFGWGCPASASWLSRGGMVNNIDANGVGVSESYTGWTCPTTGYYGVVVFNDRWASTSNSSYTLLISTCTPPSDPSNQAAAPSTICNGSSSTLSASVSGATIYWYTGSCGGTQIGTGNSLVVSPTTTTTYYARAYTSCFSTSCGSVAVTVNATVTAGAIGTAQTFCDGGGTPALLTSTTDGTGTGTITYEWYTSADGYVAIQGTASTYQPPALAATTIYKRRTKAVSGATCYSGYTATVTITVNAAVTAGAIGTAQTICNGATPALLTSTTDGTGTGTITYEWYSSADGYVAVQGTASTYQPPALTATTSYKRRTKAVSGATCYSGYTATVTITVNAAVTAGAIGTAQTFCDGGGTPALLTSTTDGTGTGTITYEWYTSADGYVAI